jgi:hypothetical protein
VLLTVLTGCEDGATGEDRSATISTTAPRTLPTGSASIEPGTYQIPKSAQSLADFTVTLPDDWTVLEGHTYLKHPNAEDELGIHAVVVDGVFSDMCQGGDDLIEVGPTALDLAAALLTRSGPPKPYGPHGSTLGGVPALSLYYTPEDFRQAACTPEGDGLRIWHSSSTDTDFVLPPGAYAWIYILEVDGQRQVFLAHFTRATSRKDVRELQAVLDSIRIEQ